MDLNHFAAWLLLTFLRLKNFYFNPFLIGVAKVRAVLIRSKILLENFELFLFVALTDL
ncbi:hypothetical protein SAMN05444277_103245 [Parafilimonas terrae]|uniref:Uncharacterized protein n=1 Tax=Parafilimonas terrae TaxID=1465490 RepID=A0A1I5UEI4_9BACT|nr:hypothetical protein SAMN05444277_103245 [Parafilimonas terrae]